MCLDKQNSFNKWTKISSLEITSFDSKIMVKNGLKFFTLKFSEPLGPFLTFFYRNEVDVTQPIRLSFKNWLDALFIAQKYKKELKADSDEQSSETTNEDGSTPTSKSLPSELGLEFDFQRLLNTASERAR